MALPINNYSDPIEDGDPCGEALDYDLGFLELEIAAKGKPGSELGGSVVASEGPDWNKVDGLIQELSSRSKDLRIGVLAVRSSLNRGGIEAFRLALEGLAIYVEDFWTGLHPRPDGDDPDDAIVRVNALADLCDPEGLLADLRFCSLSNSRSLGSFALSDWLEVHKPDSVRADSPLADIATIEAAFKDSDQAFLSALSGDLSAAIAATMRIDVGTRKHVDAVIALNCEPLLDVLGAMLKLVDEYRPLPPVGSDPNATEAAAPAAGPSGIRDRNDVIRSLEGICRWYRHNEPSSPVPALLERVKRIVTMDFVSLLAELAPKGAGEFRALAGLPAEAND